MKNWRGAFSGLMVIGLMAAEPVMAEAGLEASVQSQGRQIEALQRHVEILEEQQTENRCRIDALEDLRSELEAMTGQIGAMRSEMRDLEVEMREIDGEFAEYRDDYRHFARIKAVGEALPVLKTVSGKVYQDVTIRRVTEVGLEIRHPSGTSRVLHHDLPATLRDRFQWDEQRALACLELEKSREARWERQIAAVRRQEAEKAKERYEKEKTDRRIADLERQVRQVAAARKSPLQVSGKLGERRTVGTGSSYRYSRYYRNRYYRYRPSVKFYRINSSVCPTPSRTPVTRSSVWRGGQAPRVQGSTRCPSKPQVSISPVRRPMPTMPSGGSD